MNTNTRKKLFLVCVFLFSIAGFSQEYRNFTRAYPSGDNFRYQNNIRGDLTFIGNNIMNRDGGTTATEPNDPYNNQNVRVPWWQRPGDYYNAETGGYWNYNDYKDMRYIDVDSDPTTFCSSTANFAFPDPNCNLIRYAGLYWSATYPRDNTADPVGTPRQYPINQVKLRVPGGAYVDVTANAVDVYDGLTEPDLAANAPYYAYADVTDLITPLADPSGDYTVANIPAAQGFGINGGTLMTGGSAGGWTLVIVYENPTLPGRLITTFDGFARVTNSDTVPINYDGFTTVPFGPVNADIGTATLEGDFSIPGDFMRIQAASNGTATVVQDNSGNLDPNNFFNSDITLDGVLTTNRTPNSTNTLGWDTDFFELDNGGNLVIPNGETAATFEFVTNGDQYYPFFNSFNIEIIEPNVVLEKKVEDIGGNDITGQGVNLGQVLDYVLSFQNIGNDDATGIDPSNPDYQPGDHPQYTIRDVLPVNVTLDETNLVLPPGVTYTFDPAIRTIWFHIPNNYVNEGDPVYSIRMRVRVAENCFDFIDACSDLIENLAYSTYAGVINDNKITDDPSVTDFDACGFVTPGATNFLLDDLSDCNFERTVELCGASVVLDAGDGFDDYVWRRDDNNNGIFEPSDTLMNDGDPDNDLSTLSVTTVGTYIVDKIVADPCKGFKEIIHVVPYGSGTIPNPVIEYFNSVNGDADPTNDLAGEIVQCSVDNDLLPKLFLCGINDTRLLQVNIVDAQSIVWEQLDESSCTAAGDDCANKNLSCTWNQVAIGNDYTISAPGKFRLQVTYQNGCTSRFYFSVFQNNLNITHTKQDILCTTPGNITVTNPTSGYGYRLVDDLTGAVIVPFSTNNSFDFASGENSGYRVEVTQLDTSNVPIPGACIFSTNEIGILERDVTYAVNVAPVTCFAQGSINIQVNNADPNYEYEIRLDDGSNGGLGTLVDNETAQPDNNFTFTGLIAGDYIAIARTDDGCFYSEQVTIIDEDDLELQAILTQNISCDPGQITMQPSGGTGPYSYAIWTYVDEGGTTITSYPTINDIPPSELTSNPVFDITAPGDYTFIVFDDVNCPAFTTVPVTIVVEPLVEYNTSLADETCFGASDGSYVVNVTNSHGNSVSFTLTYPDTSTVTNASGNFTGLPQGVDYSLSILQTKGGITCEIIETFDIGGPAVGIDADAVITVDYTCLVNGTIQAQNVTGGTAPYEYSIDGVNFFSGAGADTFSNLTEGTYTITVRDASLCTFTTLPVTLNPLNEPTDLTFVSSAPNCPTQTSDVTVTVANGNTPYVFDIIAPSAIAATTTTGNSADFDGLAPNTYTFRVTDDKGCFYTEDFTINPVDQIAVNGQLDNNVTCFGLSDGAATFNVSNFVTSYDYNVTGPTAFTGTAQTANAIPLTGLGAGTYTITVTDTDTNCTATADVTIAAPPAALVISDLDVIDLSCSTTGTVPGSVTITAVDGWGGYEYELRDPSGILVGGPQSTNSFTGLTDTSGNYTVTVRDAGGCAITDTFSLNPTVAPTLEVTANSLCYDSSTGLILTANVTAGGVAPFQYRLNGGTYQGNTDFTGLGPGSYTVEVIDSKNCTGTASIDVFPTLTTTASLVKDLDCSATPDAEISINIAGGNPTFNYEVIRDGSTVQTSTPVPSTPFSYFTTTAGTYEFVITDTESCTVTTNQIVVSPNNPPTVVEVITEPLCNTSADGVAELQISGGLAPYQIVFDGSAPSAQTTYPGLVDGTYNYTVTDAKGCVFSDSVTLTAPAVLNPGTITVATDYRCDNTSATLQVTGYSGGTPGYTFSLDGVNFQGIDTFSTGIIAGTYTITVRDANGCTEETPPIDILPLDPPTDITFAQTSPTCPALVADVTLTVAGGTAPYTYEIVAPAGSVTNNGNSNVFTGLAPGTYSFQVTDDRGCVIQRNYEVTDVDRVAVVAQLTNNVSCFGLSDGAFAFTVSDFVSTYSYTVENSVATLVQSQSNINTITPIAVAGLAADTYTVIITDDTTNCTATTTMVIENPPAALDFTFTNTPVTCVANSTITVTPIGGWGSYEYQLENTVGPVIVHAYQTPNTFANVPAGTYTIYIRDAGNCIVTKPITIDPAETPAIAVNASSDYCFDSTDQASLVIDITDGIAPFTYSINGGGQTAAVGNPFTISGLIPGSYNIQVTDAYGCISNILNETIAAQLSASAVVNKALDCTVSPDAVIDVAINNGYLPYASYEVSTNGGTSWGAPVAIVGSNFSYSTATSGTYDFRITDDQGCTDITQATIDPITNPVITSLVETVSILCNGDNGATIQVNLDNTQGLAPFAISVVNTTTATNYGTQTSGLPAGTYDVTVTDAKSCTDTETIVIGEPDAITYDVNLVPITCNAATGTDPGSITVENVAGGTAEFEYHLTGNNGYSATYTTTSGGEDYTFAILEFGIYEVDVIDVNGCSVRTTNIIASPPNDLDIDVSTATPDCTTGGTAIITVASAVGSGNYEFAILETYTSPYSSSYVPADVPGGDTATFTGLTPGITYTFVVHDLTTLCYYFETADTPIDSPSNLTSTLDAVNNVTCTGSNDGSVSFSFDNYEGDATSVSYEIFNSQSNLTTGITGSSAVNPPAVGTGVSVSNLGPLVPGVYYILFTENGGTTYSGCTVASAQFTITESTNELSVTANLDKNDNCNINAGQISAIGQFGTTPYEYQLTLSTDPAPTAATWAGSTTNVFNVEGGDYIVYIKDAHGCIRFDAITVPTDPSPEISLAAANQCTADEGGYSIDIILDVAGITPHTIRVDGGAPQPANGLVNASDVITISNLSSGAHSIQILDNNGCGETENITIYPPVNVAANFTADETCVPANAGEVTVTANGGSGTYSYTQTIPAGPTNATGVFAGLTHSVAYTFEVEDTTTNCIETVSITLPTPAVPTFTLDATDVSCFGGSDGSITVNLLAGNSDTPYEYSLDGGTTRQPTNVFPGLTQGTYNVTVISAKGCLDTISIDVNEPTLLDVSASASAFSCDDMASTITVTINDATPGNPSGTGPYVYSFDNGANYQPGNTFEVPFGSPDVNVMVKDANHCTDLVVVPIPARQGVTAVINQLQAIDCNNGQEIIEIVASNGSGTYTYTELPSGNVVADPTNIILTAPGTYVYEVHDTVTNCRVTVEHTIAPYDLIDVTASVTTDATCSDSTDGVIEVTITGYTGTFDYQVLDNAGTPIGGTFTTGNNATTDPYTFNVATTLGAGTYSVEILATAFPECNDISNNVTIDAPEPLALQLISNVNANCNVSDAIVTVQATGGTGPYTYGASISGGGVPGSFTFDNTVELDPTTSLNWDIYVRDANGCIIAVPLAVTVDTDTTPDITLAIDDECADEGSFAITVSLDAVNTGVAPYTMSIDGAAFQNIASFPYTYTGLNAGAHSIEIRDANGCGEIENITIEPELTVTAIALTQPTCATNDGVIEFTVNGGSGAFTATLLQSDLTPTGIAPAGNQFTGVAFGDYIVRITDNTLGTPNCIADAAISLEEPTPVTLLTTDWTDVGCTGGSDGTITVILETPGVGVNDNPPYTFEITDGTSTFTQGTNLFTGLPAGVWDITVTSNRNCVAIDQVTINEPNALTAAITNVVPFACDVNNNEQSASIEVTITDGTADYFYSVNGGTFLPTGGASFTHDVNTAGNYDIVIRDANGCLFTIPTQVIDPLNTFTANVALSDAITCANGREEVVITVTDDGNPHTYTYELLPLGNPNGTQTATTGNTATFDLTAVGSYTFRITDTATGCYIDTATYTIAPYDLIEVSATALEPVICYGDANGSLELTVSGYTGTFDYEVFTQAGASVQTGSGNAISDPFTTTIGSLTGGNYYVTVTESDPSSTFCSDDTDVITIISPDMPLTAIVDPVAEPTCTDNQGEILVDPSGGYAPYDIVLTNTTTSQVYNANDVQSFLFTGLSAGNFTISVTDSARAPGCVYTDTEVLTAATPIIANAIPLTTALACFGDTNATVTGVVTGGGSGNYQYQLNYYDDAGAVIEISSGPQANDTFTGLGAGIYSITVSDGWNCDVETNQVTITEPTAVAASLIRTDPLTCATGVEFELTATGGASGTYEYSPDNVNWFAMTSNPMPLPVPPTVYLDGTYQFFVRDAVNGCDSVASNAITEDEIIPLELTVDNIVSVNCNGDSSGVIYASAEFGMGNYMFELFTDVGLTNSVTGSTQPSGEFHNLPAGTYYVTVISEDCVTAPQQVIIEQPEALVFVTDVVDVLCFGDENGSITVTPSGGAGGYIYAISPNLNQFDTVNTFTDLAPGDYTIIAQDQNGCFEYITETIGAPTALDTTFTTTPEICAGSEDGTISLTITGGTAPYRTALNSNADADFVQDRVDFIDMAAGNYLIFIRDANDCEINVAVDVAPGVNLNATVEPVYECTGDTPNNYVNITLEDFSVIGDVLYALDSTDAGAMQLNPDFRDIAPGAHYIAIAHSNGCVITIPFEIEGFEPLTIVAEQLNLNEITATAAGGKEAYTYYFDDVNNGSDNTFRIRRSDTYVVRVVDENGCEAITSIYMEFIDIEIPNFFTPSDGDGLNDTWKPKNQEAFPEILTIIFDRYGREVYRLGYNDQGWNGIYKGKELPSGDYWYVIKLKGEEDDREFVGHFTLYR